MRTDSHQDEAVYRRQGMGSDLGWGVSAALIIVDFVNGFNDPEVLGGGNIQAAIDATVPLLEAARRRKLPIVFTRIVYAPGQRSMFCRKIPALAELAEDHRWSQIVPQLPVREEDYIVRKTQPSAFFGTDLASWLTYQGVDTVLIAGATTSGCVRATAVDAMSLNLRAIVVEECAGDRAIGPHEASLFDIQQKYGDVQPLGTVLKMLADGAD
ncbi:MAG: isochorismatase family protein [Pigmentiphaga sp.]|nr:isochorismatase family protein [Pigmentiphaga sp.]